ncbi:hypothetical protein SMACR_06867 [Sordaria macrospora]|uniref:Uncharacterized protein n=1 Tax=Sordaria macrospora TaxID=5147 RepID=A0A8S8ZZW1_SORMA|nr:hypothetical protein SMACR_06867 [Sordaria macrospora]WPJ59615.1 hypothetical protein SMAC4_06867 [Sordaria macrospora]
MANRAPEAPMSTGPVVPLYMGAYEELNTLWTTRERNLTLSYLNHTNRDKWIIYCIRCLAVIMAGPPQEGSEPASNVPRPHAPAPTQAVCPAVRVLEMQSASTEINAIWHSRVYHISVRYMNSPNRDGWLVHFVRCLAKIVEGPLRTQPAAPAAGNATRVHHSVTYDRPRWFKTEGNGTITMSYGVQLNGARVTLCLPAGAKLYAASFARVSVLADHGYAPVPKGDIKTETRGSFNSN